MCGSPYRNVFLYRGSMARVRLYLTNVAANKKLWPSFAVMIKIPIK
jgi:hypothetical protein